MSEPSDSQKELTKLTASWLNTLGAGAIAVGVFTPISKVYELGSEQGGDAGWPLIISSLAYLFFGVVLHIVGRMITEIRFSYDAD
ncbi:hypothetical protein C0214_13620 [Methylobacterium sp. DM1]|nr:hypothetical protein C0214_13620 [Methylobacterium sp. DM1]